MNADPDLNKKLPYQNRVVLEEFAGAGIIAAVKLEARKLVEHAQHLWLEL